MEILRDLITDNVFLNFTGKNYELIFTAASTDYRVKHGMSSIPTDVIFTKITNAATATVNWTLTDATFIVISVSGACTLRMIAGKFGVVS